VSQSRIAICEDYWHKMPQNSKDSQHKTKQKGRCYLYLVGVTITRAQKCNNKPLNQLELDFTIIFILRIQFANSRVTYLNLLWKWCKGDPRAFDGWSVTSHYPWLFWSSWSSQDFLSIAELDILCRTICWVNEVVQYLSIVFFEKLVGCSPTSCFYGPVDVTDWILGSVWKSKGIFLVLLNFT
jgi:hypothetical protein